MVGPIIVKFEPERQPAMGTIPMEEMDVVINPLRQELIVNPEHPYFAQLKMK